MKLLLILLAAVCIIGVVEASYGCPNRPATCNAHCQSSRQCPGTCRGSHCDCLCTKSVDSYSWEEEDFLDVKGY